MAVDDYEEIIRIPMEPLTPLGFASFGTVIQNPTHDPSAFPSVPASSSANQGTATKFSDVSALPNHYGLASSRRPAEPKVSLFVSAPRALVSSLAEGTSILPYPGNTKTLDVPVLERHPFTTQTFIPLGLDPADRETAYIVIVAPTLPSRNFGVPVGARPANDPRPPPYPTDKPKPTRTQRDRTLSAARPAPYDNLKSDSSGTVSALFTPRHTRSRSSSSLSSGEAAAGGEGSRTAPLTEGLYRPRGSGRPDLRGAKAFIAHGGQGVTYAPGTWHAPMAVVGKRDVEFVVWQWANGVAGEDCQEVLVGSGRAGGAAAAQGGGAAAVAAAAGTGSKDRIRQVLEVVVQEGTYGVRTPQASTGVKAAKL